MSAVISLASLYRLVDAWIAAGVRVGGPKRVTGEGRNKNLALYQAIRASGELLLDPAARPRNSIKEFVFPRHEKLFNYRFQGKRIELESQPLPETRQVVIGAKPCDAAALPVLDQVFKWDYVDGFYAARRNNLTIVTLGCTFHDSHCFCTELGLGPADAKGSDAMLLELGDGTFEVRTFTEKGEQLFAGHTEPSHRSAELPAAKTDEPYNLPAIQEYLEHGFENPEWQALGLRCLGCGACAYTCPTCHCFDMVDEGNAAGGARVRNWDACQFPLFTLHASGHNPRANQAQRQRQRVDHKFRIYQQKFHDVLCTGCGNCSRNCPVGLGVKPVLERIRKITEDQAPRTDG